jgi:hypothetical protein
LFEKLRRHGDKFRQPIVKRQRGIHGSDQRHHAARLDLRSGASDRLDEIDAAVEEGSDP